MPPTRTDDNLRRRYWIEQLDAAWEFMSAMERYPVRECSERLVSLPEAAREAGVDVRFSTKRTARGMKRVFRLREGLIPDFLSVAQAMNRRGWVLKVEDGFRPRAMQKALGLRPVLFDAILRRTIWELGGAMPSAEHLVRRASGLIAPNPKVGTHMSGSAMDISVLRRDGSEVDRGAPYLEISALTPMGCPFIPRAAQRNRAAITDLMARHGFMAYPFEFWHYSKGDAYAEYLTESRRPGRYGAVDMEPATGAVTPIGNPCRRLNSLAEIRTGIDASLRRRRGA